MGRRTQEKPMRGRRIRRYVLTIALCSLVLPAGLAQASDPAISGAEGRSSDLPLKAEMTAMFSGGLSRLYLIADPSVVWNPGLLSAGVGTELVFGMTQFDIYLNPELRLGLGWLRISAGYLLALAQPPGGEGLGGPTAGLAISPEPFEVAYGRMGFELALDFSIIDSMDSFTALAGAPTIDRLLGSALLSGRAGLGISYSFELF